MQPPNKCIIPVEKPGISYRATRLCQRVRLLPTNPLRKDIFRGIVLKIDAIEMCFFLVIEKREGNLSLRVKLSIHLSSQNLIFCPLPSWNWPRFRKDSLTFNNPLQKCESPCFLCTCAMVLSLTYFLHKKSCQTPSSLINLNNHLPSRQRFWISMFRISNLPWSFGWQIILHFANLYFFLCSSLCELDCELDLLSCHCDLDCEFMSLLD
jgi:hypothetical protein